MKLSASLTAAAALFSHAAAVDLYLYRGSSCTGAVYSCINAAPNSCCQNGALYRSGAAINGPRPGVTIRHFIGNGPAQCSGISSDQLLGTCVVGNDETTRALLWFNGSKRSAEATNEDCVGDAQGTHMYSDGVNMYAISPEKMESLGLEIPDAEKEQESFFKMHADSILAAPQFSSYETV